MEYSDYIESRTAASALTGAEMVGISQGGVARRTTAQDIADLATGSGGGVDDATIDTSGGTITFNFQEVVSRIFIGNASFATPKTIAYSEATNALKFEFLFQVTNVAAVLTLQSNSLVNAIAGIWDSTGKTWTPNDIGRYVLEGTYDGTNWWIKIRGFYE